MFYYFRFIRFLNTSNCFIVTFSFNDFIHELKNMQQYPSGYTGYIYRISVGEKLKHIKKKRKHNNPKIYT